MLQFFLIENNQYSFSTPASAQPGKAKARCGAKSADSFWAKASGIELTPTTLERLVLHVLTGRPRALLSRAT